MVNRVKWWLLLLVACQNHDATPRTETGSATPPPAVADARGKADEPEEPRADARVKVDEPETPPDPSKQIYELAAVPAWQAVVDRNLYLDRRDQHGVVYGTLGASITIAHAAAADAAASEESTPYTWLVDDTEGNGSLAIRVALGGFTTPKLGDRLALSGAWALDPDRHWFWKVSLVTALAAAPPSKAKDPPAIATHVIVDGELPNGARPISLAKETEAAYFTVVGGTPLADGDGWLVADELGNPPYALLDMPGERTSYGAQDLRTPDERWTLKRGQTYWVRIGPVHKHGPDKPATINAHTAPVRVK